MSISGLNPNPAIGPVPTYSAPAFDPNSQNINNAAQGLETTTGQNELLQLGVQQNMQNLQTENTIRTAIQQAMHAIANQAESLSQQFIGDEIAQAKKGNDNSGKAV